MSDLNRGGGTMALLESKQGETENWNDGSDQVSPMRKHLLSTYLQVQDEESLPLLSEYFGVALSFMALGALVRASNSTKKRRKNFSDEERLDLRACSRFQRMALESMLREAMERLRGLAHNAYQLEERVGEMVAEEVVMDKEKVALLSRLAETEKIVHELKALRKAEGRANERVMSIVAAKEQDWLKEKRSLQKEIDRVKDNLNAVYREVKYQSKTCRSMACEHCKGIERVVRNVRGRLSLRELNYREASLAISARREAQKMVEHHEEVKEEKVVIKAIEHKKKKNDLPGHLNPQTKVEKHVEWSPSASSSGNSSNGGAGQSTAKGLIAKQQQDMESELANILRRVGMLKQRSQSSSATASELLTSLQERRKASAEDSQVSHFAMDDSDLVQVEAQAEAQEYSISDSKLSGHPTELPGASANEESLFSLEEDADLLELEKALELEEVTGTVNAAGEEGSLPGDLQQELMNFSEVQSRSFTTERCLSDEDKELAEFESCLSLEEEILGYEKYGNGGELSQDSDRSYDSEEFFEAADVEFGEKDSKLTLEGKAEVGRRLEAGNQGANLTEDSSDDMYLDMSSDSSFSLRPQESRMGDSLPKTGIAIDSVSVVDVKPYTMVEVESKLRADTLEHSDILQNSTVVESLSQGQQVSPAYSNTAHFDHSTGLDEVGQNDDLGEDFHIKDNPTKLMSEDTEIFSVDESSVNAEEVKAVDGGDNAEEELASEMVPIEESPVPSEGQDSLLNPQTVSVPEDADLSPLNQDVLALQNEVTSEIDSCVHDQEESSMENLTPPSNEGQVVEAEIPVFERDNGDDSAGELSEPDEKRVCGSGSPDSSPIDSGSAYETSLDSEANITENVEHMKADSCISAKEAGFATELEAATEPSSKVVSAEDNLSLEQGKSGELQDHPDAEMPAAVGG